MGMVGDMAVVVSGGGLGGRVLGCDGHGRRRRRECGRKARGEGREMRGGEVRVIW
jgi:hypothetical protein